jgi:hypothetical protein
VLVVLLFLRRLRDTMIPAVAIPLSLVRRCHVDGHLFVGFGQVQCTLGWA